MKSDSGFLPYRAMDSGRTVEEVWDAINASVFFGHCQEDSGIRIDSLSDYARLLDAINDAGILCRTYSEMDLSAKVPDDRVICLIRHDVDIDIVAALRSAQIEREKGIRSSWYILHTSPYYGEWKKGAFFRHGCMRHVYRQLEDLGHEVGLHTDGLFVYQEMGIDGAEAVATEIEWMRQAGLRVSGTTAHNSVGAYGACNYAIFKGRPQHLWGEPGKCPDTAEKDGKVALLQQLDEGELGLTYECNEVFWQDGNPVAYGCIMRSDHWVWEDEKANSRIRQQKEDGTYRSPDGFGAEELIDRLGTLPKGTILNLVVHPVYYGHRDASNVEPSLGVGVSSV